MALIETNWNPTSRQLRQFGGLCLVALPLLGWLWSASSTMIATLAGIGLLIAVDRLGLPESDRASVCRADVDHRPDWHGRRRIGNVLDLHDCVLADRYILPHHFAGPLAVKPRSTRDQLLATKASAAISRQLLPSILTLHFLRECSVSEPKSPEDINEFEKLGEEEQLSLVSEFVLFIKENKAWWMIPILLVLGAVSLLVMLSTTGAAPFIYTLF